MEERPRMLQKLNDIREPGLDELMPWGGPLDSTPTPPLGGEEDSRTGRFFAPPLARDWGPFVLGRKFMFVYSMEVRNVGKRVRERM